MADEFGLETYLYDHIPLSKHLGVTVDHASVETVRLVAPLAPNLNHWKSGFGGSISAVAILAGWSILWCRLHGRAGGHNIVIQKNTIDYVAPVLGDFTAVCAAPLASVWQRFEQTFNQRGRARIDLDVQVRVGDRLTASLAGRFVALRADDGP